MDPHGTTAVGLLGMVSGSKKPAEADSRGSGARPHDSL